MFTLPPRPPKDFVLKTVPIQRRSAPEFTPDAPPRVTQTTFGQFCAPVSYQDDEVLEEKDKITKSLKEEVLDNWVKYSRDSWVNKPGQDDFFLYDIYRGYSVKQKYDPRHKTKEQIFNRSFIYEPEYAEMKRLEKLQRKCNREQEEFQQLLQNKKENPVGEYEDEKIFRWQERPELLKTNVDSFERRRCEMLSIGLPFKHTACKWYEIHYPTEKLPFRPAKFSK